jgi:hypothetical protein
MKKASTALPVHSGCTTEPVVDAAVADLRAALAEQCIVCFQLPEEQPLVDLVAALAVEGVTVICTLLLDPDPLPAAATGPEPAQIDAGAAISATGYQTATYPRKAPTAPSRPAAVAPGGYTYVDPDLDHLPQRLAQLGLALTKAPRGGYVLQSADGVVLASGSLTECARFARKFTFAES